MKKEIKVRLIKHITFLEDEIQDYENFKTLSWMEYNTAMSISDNLLAFPVAYDPYRKAKEGM